MTFKKQMAKVFWSKEGYVCQSVLLRLSCQFVWFKRGRRSGPPEARQTAEDAAASGSHIVSCLRLLSVQTKVMLTFFCRADLSCVWFQHLDSESFKSWMNQIQALFLRRTRSRVTPAKSVVVLRWHKTNLLRRVRVHFPWPWSPLCSCPCSP